MRVVDLRSDTVTLPTEEMMEAIWKAKLGDDVYGEDPTVNRLEELAAENVGKEAALLVTSGTQGNLTSILTHTRPGDEAILEAESHIYYYEVAGISAVAGVQAHPIKGRFGVLDPVDVKAAIRHKDIHCPETTLICLEETHNRAGGAVLTPGQISPVYDIASSENIGLHIDGARIFNAAVALGVDVKALTKHCDSVMFCLSKGLSAPIGSILAGGSDFIRRARKKRKMLGGGMRQAGIIAAAGIVALEKMVDRLREDHENARSLAEGLSRIDGISLDLNRVQSNIIVFDVSGLGLTSQDFVAKLGVKGIRATVFGGTLVRMVTHRGIGGDDIAYTLETLRSLFSKA